MVVCTFTKKQILKTITVVLAGIAVVLLVVLAACGSVTASAQGKKTPVYCVDRKDNRIAVTFDCAWGNSNTDELIDILREANAKATFFVTGEFCDKYPQDVKKLAEAGHSIQNHSDKHPHVKGMNVNSLIADTKECSRKIEALTGKKPAYYRAPYGEYDDMLMTTIEGMGCQVIQWSADSIDWEDPDALTIRKRIIAKTEPGGILLFHNDLDNTTEALPALLTELKKKGFEFVTVDELVYKSDYYIDSSGKQIADTSKATIVPIRYSDNEYLESAFEKIRENFSTSEIYDLSSVAKVTMIERIKSLMTEEEIQALREASYDELKKTYENLVYAAEHYGAGGTDITETNEEDRANDGGEIVIENDVPRIVPPAEIK